MKVATLLFVFGILMNQSFSQVICIQCFEQNTRVSDPVNNLIVNGSFENGCLDDEVFSPIAVNYACDLTGWTCTGGGSLSYPMAKNSNDNLIPDGLLGAYLGNYFCYGCGYTLTDTLCLVSTGCAFTGIPPGFPKTWFIDYGDSIGVSLSQTVNGLIPGNHYVLEFWAGGEADWSGGWAGRGLFAVDVGFGDTLMRNKRTSTPATMFPDTIGTRYIIQFLATSASHTIKFTNWGHICGDCTEIILDDVQLFAVADLNPAVPVCYLGLEQNQDLDQSVFPVPVSDLLNIISGIPDECELRIYSVSMEELLRTTFRSELSVDVKSWAPGVYFYVIINEGSTQTGKFLKE